MNEAELREALICEAVDKLKNEIIAKMESQIFNEEERFKYNAKTQKQLIIQNMTWRRAIEVVKAGGKHE